MELQKSDIIIRPIHLRDLSGAMKLSSDQGWNQTEADWAMMIENTQNSCLLAEYHEKIVGTTTAINYSNDVAWISMVLVDKEYRGHGISSLLLENIFRQLTRCKSIKLDATPEGQPVYKKYDFIDEYFITRMTCDAIKNISIADSGELQPIQQTDMDEIIACDQHIFGVNRSQLIEYLFRKYPHKAWMLRSSNSLSGFVLGRDGRKYNHIGPVIASATNDAKKLIAKLLIDDRDKSFVVDVMNDKTELVDWLTSIGFVRQRPFVRMYQHNNPFPGNIHQQYLICGPEFG